MKNEKGHILVLVVVFTCLITLAVMTLAGRTIYAAYFADRREKNVRALLLAENAAMEGYWRVVRDLSYTGSGQKYFGNDWYRYSISVVDASHLDITGEGYAGDARRRVVIRLERVGGNYYHMSSWRENN